ncbi:hypothetical protein CFO_g3612 [Ceratocystis platani]|uniref:Uncharacterized protein n=1 Tax=Ceratocystis fimbriata f. sp. platani TaxID=88771 RepID=A0A0F8B2H7_CERFI|nr:hypothetical protein CFO_g3612 [Ceratocystis platani]
MPMSRATTPASTPPSPLEHPQAESMTPQASAVQPSRAQISIFSGSQASSDQSHGYFRRERSSTIASSDIDGGDAASRDDDTDFRSERDIVFDSIRTHSSMLNRTVETPLESVFNDSPPGTTTGRTSSRRSPLPAHIRSQSVPVVNDPSENAVANANPKFGTWGMGSKTASEDWGEDFEFGDEPTAIDANTADSELRSSFLMLQLWEEAEGIIALASPDDEELESGVEAPASPIDFPSDLSDQVLDDSFDEADISRLDDLENPDHNISSDNVPTNPVFARRRSVLMPDDDIFGGGGSTLRRWLNKLAICVAVLLACSISMIRFPKVLCPESPIYSPPRTIDAEHFVLSSGGGSRYGAI